ncbi:MAG: glycosyl transferase [Candidatus Saccharibacteria bacterium]|nr:glycosyl transferase [Candidatus Saccharibacteria bacterium]
MRVYILGSKGIPAKYGGFETFADRLISGSNGSIEYVVTGMADKASEYIYNGARCIQFKTKNSALGRMIHTWQALFFVFKDAKSSSESAVYILGCRAGIVLPFFRPFLKKRNVRILVNPDGAEWKRAKWNPIAKLVVLIFEHFLVKSADVVICDSRAIVDIMHNEFNVPPSKLKFIAYGSDVYDVNEFFSENVVSEYNTWLQSKEIATKPYYLMVGRFVPENNFELIINEFMRSNSESNLVIVSNITKSKFYDKLESATGMKEDSRVKLVGTLYDQNVLKLLRANAVAYIHGHEVGGTNPSLLEALGTTNVNLIYDVSFNREVASNTGLYFSAKKGNLAKLIEDTDIMKKETAKNMGLDAKRRIQEEYSWKNIILDYENLFSE